MPNRRVVEAVMRHVWLGGADAADPDRLAALRATLAPQRDPAGDDVKAELRVAGQAALAQDVYGVPTMMCNGRAFWGDDALPIVRAAMAGDPSRGRPGRGRSSPDRGFSAAEWRGGVFGRPDRASGVGWQVLDTRCQALAKSTHGAAAL